MSGENDVFRHAMGSIMAGLDARPRVAPLDALQHDIGTVWSEVMLMKQCFR